MTSRAVRTLRFILDFKAGQRTNARSLVFMLKLAENAGFYGDHEVS